MGLWPLRQKFIAASNRPGQLLLSMTLDAPAGSKMRRRLRSRISTRIAAQVPALFETLSGMDIKQLMANVQAMKKKPKDDTEPKNS